MKCSTRWRRVCISDSEHTMKLEVAARPKSWTGRHCCQLGGNLGMRTKLLGAILM